MENDWYELLKDEFKKDYFIKLMKFLDKEYAERTIYPPREQIYNALNITPYKNVSVVILGQDPYINEHQAHGMAFSVNIGVKVPPSLRNIYKELQDDLNYSVPNHGNLKKWAEQGVLLLNTVLTVRANDAFSHDGAGWEIFADKIISLINEKDEPVVFLLWGNEARKKKALITNKKHFIIESSHPSPLAARRGFFGSKPFSKTNEFLESCGKNTIAWQIENV